MTASHPMDRRSFLSRGVAAGGAILLGVGAADTVGTAVASGASTATRSGGSRLAKPGVGTGSPKRGGSAVIGTTADIDGFVPSSNHWDNNGFLYANTVFDPLTALAADGTVRPYLCKSITPNPDSTVWTMTLRPGITFTDGSALTSSVVKANFDALTASPLTGFALTFLSAVATPDPMTVVFTCSAPFVALPAALATQVGYMVGTAMLDAAAKGGSPPTPVGTGPFVYANWQPNDHFTATRNPHYWRSGFPYLDQITFRPIPDTTQREQTLRTGGVDLILSIDPNTIDHFRGQSGYQVVDSLNQTAGQPDMDFIMLNCQTPPTDDLRIRQALAKGLDQAQIRAIFGGGLVKAATGMFPSRSPYSGKTGYPTFDPTGAKALVAAYKKGHGSPALELVTVPDPRLTKLTEVIQQMWQQVGFTVTIKSIEQATLISNALTGEFQALTYELFAAPDPSVNDVWLSTSTVSPVGGVALNFARNSDPQVEADLVVGRSSLDRATRVAAYRQVDRRLATDLPFLWLGETPWSEVGDARIRNFANPVYPDGSAGKPFDNGIFFPTQIWMAG